jgi:DNA topoisomerase VI subunit B
VEFCNRKELVNQTGHQESEWPLVVLKELVDNALDECEEAGIPPVISVDVKGDTIIIADNGRGIPAKTITSVLNYNIRVSSREAYASPTRGAQGNALKTIMPMAYVLDDRGEDAVGETFVEAHGIAHRIRFAVDHISQEPKIGHTTGPSDVLYGTRITVTLPGLLSKDDWWSADRRHNFLTLAESYAWMNPHLTLQVTWNGESKIDYRASAPNWKKWLPSWPTSAHWYDESRFRRYMAAHIAHRESVTVREFISEFDGMSGTAKQRLVLAEIGASHVSLHAWFGRDKANGENIARLLATIKKYSKPVKPKSLGIIGKHHLFKMMETAGGDPRTFKYVCTPDETDGVPHVVEYAFGVCREWMAGGVVTRAKTITGVNWSPGISNPFRRIGSNGDSLDALLERARAGTKAPVIQMLHIAQPGVAYLDRGKSAIVIKGKGDHHGED